MDTATLIRDALTRSAEHHRKIAEGIAATVDHNPADWRAAFIDKFAEASLEVFTRLADARTLDALAGEAADLARLDGVIADNLSLETTVGALRDELAREQADHKRTADALLAAQGSDTAGVVMVEQPEQDYARRGIDTSALNLPAAAYAPPFVEATEAHAEYAMSVVLDDVAENVRADDHAEATADAAAVTKERRDTPAAQAIANLANRITPKDTK